MKDLRSAFDRHAIRNFPNGVLVLFDSDLRYRLVGPETLPFSEREASAMKGKTIHELFPGETAIELEAQLRATIEGSARSFDVSYDGRIHHIETQPTEIEGEQYGVLVTQDVTENRRTTRQLELLNRIVRHDIRNDMTVLLGWAEMLDQHTDTGGREHLQRILDSGEHVVELTEIARDYVELVTNSSELELTSIPLRPVLENELALRRASFPEAEIATRDGIPSVEVAANEMLGSVFRNLLNNAIQHNDEDEPVVEVSFEVRDETVAVRITDNGPGIPDGQKESIFGKDETSLETSGAGVGLYLVDALVDQYDGDVWAEDNEPEGAVFVVQLRRTD